MIYRSLGGKQLLGAGRSGWLRGREKGVWGWFILHLPVPKGTGERSPDRSSQGLVSRPYPSWAPLSLTPW